MGGGVNNDGENGAKSRWQVVRRASSRSECLPSTPIDAPHARVNQIDSPVTFRFVKLLYTVDAVTRCN
jgi:hypothetical protein